jgi:homoserine O-acetyltransferase
MSDPAWRGGDYYDGALPAGGQAIARMIGHVTYLSEQALERKFARTLQRGGGPLYTLEHEFAVESYLEYQGESFNARFDPNSYLYITNAMDYWDLPARYGSLDAALARSQAAFLLLSFTSDWLYPTAESLAIAESLRRVGRPARHVEIESTAGHDAFLVDDEQQAPLIAGFLTSL